MLRALAVLLAAGVGAGGTVAGAEAAGGLDTSYGNRGRAVVPGANVFFSAGADATPDGGLVLAGGRIEPRAELVCGRLDAGFGRSGEVLLDFGEGRRPAAFAILPLPDGRSLVAGTDVQEDVDGDYGRLLLARFLPDGRPDPMFDRDGVVELRPARRTAAAVFSIASAPDGGILAGDGASPTLRRCASAPTAESG